MAEAVSAGQLAFGMTDTDDAMVEVEQGMPVAIVYPDQAADGIGTLFIPNTVMMIKGCPHPEAAKRLIDFLLSPAVEKSLAECPSAQIPLNPQCRSQAARRNTEDREADASRFPGRRRQMGRRGAVYSR